MYFNLNSLLIFSFFIWYFYIVLIKPRVFNVSFDSFSLNIFSSLFSQLLQILETSNVLSQTHDVLRFLKLLYFSLITIDVSHPNLFKLCY